MCMCGGGRGRGGASDVAQLVENPPANVGDVRDVNSISGSERSPGGKHGNSPVFLPGEFCELRSLVGFSPWGRRETQLKQLSMHVPLHIYVYIYLAA